MVAPKKRKVTFDDGTSKASLTSSKASSKGSKTSETGSIPSTSSRYDSGYEADRSEKAKGPDSPATSDGVHIEFTSDITPSSSSAPSQVSENATLDGVDGTTQIPIEQSQASVDDDEEGSEGSSDDDSSDEGSEDDDEEEMTNVSGFDITFENSQPEVSDVEVVFGEESSPDLGAEDPDASIEELVRNFEEASINTNGRSNLPGAFGAVEHPSRMTGEQTTTVHSNALLSSLIEYYLKKENPDKSETQQRAHLRTVLANLSKVGVTYDLTHLSLADHDSTRQNYFAGFERVAEKENVFGPRDSVHAVSMVNTAQIEYARAMDNPFPEISNRVGGPQGELLRYIRVVGKGGQGKVWHVKHVLDDQDYALKMIKLPAIIKGVMMESDTRMAKVLNEMKILAALDHPNIVRYYYCWIGHNSAIPQGIRTPACEKEEFMSASEGLDTQADGYTLDSRIDTIETTEENAGENTGETRDFSSTEARQLIRRQKIGTPAEPGTHTLYIVMSLAPFALSEHLFGPNNSEVPQHCFCVFASLTIFLELLTGVAYLHNRNLIHRDLKPANIFLHPSSTAVKCCKNSSTFSPRIGDFGLATVVDLKTTGPRVGTSFYTPPERGTHEKIDVYALGIVFMELFYRFGTGTERAIVLNKIVNCREFPDDTPAKVKEVVSSCIEKDLDKRWGLERLSVYCVEWKRGLVQEREGGGSDEAVWAQPGSADV
jgi:serine/threonine protein kinase